MMTGLIAVMVWLLIPAGILPIVTAAVLSRYRHADSPALRDRWHLSVVLAILGGLVSLLALNRVAAWGIHHHYAIALFALVLIAVDVVSAKWLIDYWRGAFR